MNIFINIELVPMLSELMNSQEERGGIFLYREDENILIEKLIEYENESKDKQSSLLGRLTSEQAREVGKTDLGIGGFHNHPSGVCEMSEQDKYSLEAAQKILKEFKLLIITKTEIKLYE